MEERLGDEKETQIIWTSSTAAMLSSFDVNDIEDRHGYVFGRHPEQLCYPPLMSMI